MQVPRMTQTNVLGWANDPKTIREKQTTLVFLKPQHLAVRVY